MVLVTEVAVQRDTESGSDSSGLHDQFMTVVAHLTRGALTFPAPFDLASSAALAKNDDTGALAARMFEATAARDCGYEVTITALTPDTDELRREIINTTVAGTALLFALLEGLMDELDSRLSTGQPTE